MISNLAIEHRRVLDDVLEAVLQCRHAEGVGHMCVEHNFVLWEIVVDRGVDDELGGVHVRGTFEHGAIAVDLDQIGCGHLVVEQPELVEEEVVVRAGHSHRDVVPDRVVVPEVLGEPVHRCQIDPSLPFLARETRGVRCSEISCDDFLVGHGVSR